MDMSSAGRRRYSRGLSCSGAMTADALLLSCRATSRKPDILALCFSTRSLACGGRSLTLISKPQHLAKEERDIGGILSLTGTPIVNRRLAREGQQL